MKILNQTIVYKREGVYACFPGMYKLTDGRIIIRFSTRTHASHVDDSGGMCTLVSDDECVSWKETSDGFYFPQWRSSDGSLARADAVSWVRVPAERRTEHENRGIEVRNTPGGTVAYAYGVYAQKSVDGGRTWIDKKIEYPHRPLTMTFHENATFLRLDDSRLIKLVYSRTKAGRRYYELYALRSDDNGESWYSQLVASDPDEETGYGESAILACSNGDLLVVMRTESTSGTCDFMSMIRSSDDGKSWSTPTPTNMYGHPPDLLRLSNGHIVCTFGYRKDPMGIRAMISTDDGYTFHDDSLVILRDDGKPSADGGRGGDLGYPVSVELSDRTIFTIYYMTCSDGVTHIAGTRWREE